MLLRCEGLEPPMSHLGQNEKVSRRAFLDRCTPESGRGFDRGERQLRANTDPEQSQHMPRVRKAELFDYLIGGGDQGRRNGKAEHPRGPGVDDQLELGRLHDRQIRRLRALEDAAGIDSDLTGAFLH